MADGLVKVRVTHVIDPHNFHAQVGDEEAFKQFEERQQELHAWGMEQCIDTENLGLDEETKPGTWVLAYSDTWAAWVRGQVNLVDYEDGEVDVNCVDYGTTELVPLQQVLSHINPEMTRWRPEAQACRLYGVSPPMEKEAHPGPAISIISSQQEDVCEQLRQFFCINYKTTQIASSGQWITRASNRFHDLLVDEKVTGQVMGRDKQGLLELDLLLEDDGNISNASELMVKEGLAKLVTNQTTKVPDFDLSQLWPKRKPAGATRPSQATPTDSVEANLFRTMNGADQTSHKWVPSDQLIGQNYQPNIDDSTVNHLKEELQQMELYTHDAEEWRESEESWGHQLKKSPTKRTDCHSDHPRGDWSSEMSRDDRSSRRPRDPLLGCDQSWSYSELRDHSSRRQPNQVSGGHWEDSYGQQQDWGGGERHLSVAGHGRSFKQHQDNHSPKMTPPKRDRFKQSADNQENRFRSDNSYWSREMPAGDCYVDKTYQAAYQSSANDLSGDEHHQYGRRARKSKCHKQQSGSSDIEHKDSPPLQSNEAGRAARGDGGRQESGSRYGPRAGGRQARNSGNDDSLQNDYLWHRRKVDKRARAILSELNPDRLHETVEAFNLVIYPVKSLKIIAEIMPNFCAGSQFHDTVYHLSVIMWYTDLINKVIESWRTLPGPKELHICVEAIFMYAVDHPEHLNAITALLAAFSEDDSFFVTMMECLPTLMDNFVRETTNVVLQRQRDVFLQLLGLLYTECHLWNTPAADPIINCVTQYFEKWCMYTNKSGSTVDPLQSAYLNSLDALLQTAGPALEEHFPAKLTAGFTQLSSKIIDTTIDVSLRLQIAVLMVKRVSGWSIRGHEQRHTSSSAVQCMTASEHKQVQVQPEELDPLHLAPELLSSSTQTTVPPPDVNDPYCRVRRMLQTLNMEELLDIFYCNAIRDSLLDMPFQDLKELLREVDIKPGYVWEIKSYLENSGQLPWSPVQRSSPNSVRSCYTDQTDPELNEINERPNNPKNHRPYSRNTGAAASKLSARFIPPHRLTLLTPSNFMAGNSETVADHIQMVTSPSEYATEKDDVGVFMKNNEPANADYASSDDEPNTSADLPEKNFPPCNFTTALVTMESEVSCNEQSNTSAVTTNNNNGNRYYPPHSIAGYQSQKQCDYSLPQASYSNTASPRKSEYPAYLVSNGGAQNLKMIPARADQDTNWRVKSRQGPTNVAANRDEG